MKLSINLMRVIIKLTILLVIIVMLFIITLFLYSAKYWPDVYNYFNANITIKRIPKISEIETVLIYETTEIYETTDTNEPKDMTTVDYGDKDYFSLDEVEYDRRKKWVRVEDGIDYSELPTRDVIVDFIFYVDPEKELVKDLVDESKLTTRNVGDVETIPGIFNNHGYLRNTECTNATDTDDAVFPWVTAIFVKNETSNQFDYYCDGALLSDTVVITAASCIQKPNTTSEDLLVVLGKRSLRVMAENEIIAKIKEVHIHDNFTGTEQNLALLVMKDPVTLNDRVQPARLSDGGDESATTGWAISGDLTLISFEVGRHDCNKDLTLKTFCALYGNDVTVCPSFGGVYVTRQSNDWFLRGIRADEPMNNSFCVDRTVVYTELKSYSDWIHLYLK